MKRTVLAIPDSGPLISLGVADRLELSNCELCFRQKFRGAKLLPEIVNCDVNELRRKRMMNTYLVNCYTANG